MKPGTEQNDLNHRAHHSPKNNLSSLSILAFTGIKRKFSLSLLLAKGTYFFNLLQENKQTKITIEH